MSISAMWYNGTSSKFLAMGLVGISHGIPWDPKSDGVPKGNPKGSQYMGHPPDRPLLANNSRKVKLYLWVHVPVTSQSVKLLNVMGRDSRSPKQRYLRSRLLHNIKIDIGQQYFRLPCCLTAELCNHLPPGSNHHTVTIASPLLVVESYLRGCDNIRLTFDSSGRKKRQPVNSPGGNSESRGIDYDVCMLSLQSQCDLWKAKVEANRCADTPDRSLKRWQNLVSRLYRITLPQRWVTRDL